VIATGVLAVGVSMSAALAAGGSARAGGPATAVVYQVSGADQRATLAYWTRARMLAVRPAAVPQAAAAPSVLPPKGIPTAAHYIGEPQTGALFSVAGGKAHFCSASVVNSTLGELVLTAAHCVYSNSPAKNIEYVPWYHDGKLPYGAWPVQTVTVAQGWQKSHDPNLDFAFLAVAPSNGKKIQAVTGGLTIGFTRWYRQDPIEVIGYNDPDAEPIRCQTKSFPFRVGQMEFYCHGYWTGTSGGPWIIGYNAKTGSGTVFGVIGGYEQGGIYEWASYSAYFGAQARALFGQAEKPAPTPTPTPTPTVTATQAQTSAPNPAPTSANGALQDLSPVHLAERVSEQL
jgi:V8-like Glu-specific endopeptidase